MAISPPTLPSSNIVKPSNPASSIRPCTTRFVEVPIRVHIPPKIAAYESGIRNFLRGRPTRLAHALICGMKITTIGVLFRKADAEATTPII